MITSFISILLLFVLVGILSTVYRKNTTSDYLTANKSTPPWLAGLSAVATNNSGYMFIGMIGITYQMGLSSIWFMIGWIAGDFFISLILFRKIKEISLHNEIQSFGDLLAIWKKSKMIWLQRIAGIISIIVLSIYAAAQFKAGAKATEVILEWESWIGVTISALIVLLYSVFSGIRASIWTDASQSFIMLIGMFILMVVGLNIEGIWITLNSIPYYLNWFPNLDKLGILLFVFGWFFGGIAVAGQPHILIRYISLDKVQNLNKMRFYYYSWYIVFHTMTIIVGLLTRAIFPELGSFDAEVALPMMAIKLLPVKQGVR